MRKQTILYLLFPVLTTAPIVAQQLPHTDVLLFNITKMADSTWLPAAPRFLTAFNPKGYNNQPCFFGNNELWLTVQMPGDTTQTEIYALDLAQQTITRVTATRTAEYSPTPMPGGRRFSAVRVEEDGTQRLWSFPMDRTDDGRPEFPAIRGVGYHCWLSDTLAAVFIVGENDGPHTLYTVGTRSQRLLRVTGNPGRSLVPLPNGQLAYVQKATEQTWFLKTYNPQQKTSEIILKMPGGTEDFAVLPDGTYIAGNAAKLLQYKPGRNTDWKEIADLSKYGVKSISRLAVRKDGKLAVVVTR